MVQVLRERNSTALENGSCPFPTQVPAQTKSTVIDVIESASKNLEHHINDGYTSVPSSNSRHHSDVDNLCRVCHRSTLIYDGGDIVCPKCGAVDDEDNRLYAQGEDKHYSPLLEYQYQRNSGVNGTVKNNIWSITRSGSGTAILTRDEKERLGLQTGAYRYIVRSSEEKVVKIIQRVCDKNNLALPERLVKEAAYWATKITNELVSKREKERIKLKVSPAEVSLFSIRKACKTCRIPCTVRRLVHAHRRIGYRNIEDKKILRNLRRISFVTGVKYETISPRDYVFNLTNILISNERIRLKFANIANPLDYLERRVYTRSLEILEGVRGEGRNNVLVAAAAICIADKAEGELIGIEAIANVLNLDKYKLSLVVEHTLSQAQKEGKNLKFWTNPVAAHRSQISGEFARFVQSPNGAK